MKAMEVFYNEKEADEFIKSLYYEDADAEKIQSEDEDADEIVWIVYFNPPKLRKL